MSHSLTLQLTNQEVNSEPTKVKNKNNVNNSHHYLHFELGIQFDSLPIKSKIKLLTL